MTDSPYLKAINSALSYIEENLERPISLDELGNKAGISPYHFHRMFQAFTGYTPGEYIRKRRLTEAAMKLLKTDERLIDIALDYCFQSQESFTRAFRKQFKTTPARYRNLGENRYLFERKFISEETLIHWNGGITMQPQIIEKESFKVIGILGEFTLENNTIPQMWEAFIPRMGEIGNKKNPQVSYGICSSPDPDANYKEFTEQTLFNELVCQEVEHFDSIPAGMVTRTIPTGKYAVFTHKGPLANLKATYDYIYKNWLPGSGYTLPTNYDFERYDERFNPMNQENSEIDIFVPIKEVG